MDNDDQKNDHDNKKEDFVSSAESKKEKKDPSGKNKRKNRNVILQFILSLFSLGIFSRFFPRKKGGRKSWFPTVVFLSIILTFMVIERFYKMEFNKLVEAELNVQDVLPEVLPFEDGENNLSSLRRENTELKEKVSSLLKKVNFLESKKINDSVSGDTGDQVSENNEVIALKKELEDKESIIAALTNTASELNASLESIKTEIPPVNLASLTEVGLKSGCNSRFSEQRSQDIFSSEFNNFWVNWSGIVKSSNNDSVLIQDEFNENNLAKVHFKNPGDGYYLEKGQKIRVTFLLNKKGNCSEPFEGVNGKTVK